MLGSKIHLEEIDMVTLEEVPEDARKAFEEHRRAAEERRRATEAKELQEFLACFKKDQQGVVTQDKQVILPPLDHRAELTCNVSTSSPSVSREVLSNMLVDHNKTMISQMQQTMEEAIHRFFRKLNISYNSPIAHMNHHASNSFATHVPLEITKFNMSLNYFPSQAPSARDTFLDIEVLRSETVFSLPVVHHTSMILTPNDYFVSNVNSHVDVATYSDSVLVASASNYSYVLVHAYNSEYVQKSMSTMHSGISNIQHAPAYSHSLIIEQIHMSMNNYHDQTNIMYPKSFHEASYVSGPNNL
jgi:hypothetical protein